MSAMLEVLKALPGVTVRPDFFDRDTYLLNCRNGTVNLKDGKLYPHRREDFITKVISIDFDEKASPSNFFGCPQWLKFLDQTFGVESEVIPYIQRCFGYALTGDMSEQCFFILHGEGANGKSTLLETIKYVLGEYGKKAAPDTFMEKKGDASAGYELESLVGARFVIADETQENRRLDEGIIKRITGGDMVSCRHMRQDFYEYLPSYKIFLASNHRPIIKGTDKGIWRRIQMIPFKNQIQDDQRDPYLKEKLKTEAPGILAWMVNGCLAWQNLKGLRPPREILEATEEYKGEQDVLGDFFNEYCIFEPNCYVERDNLHRNYLEWCKKNEQTALSLGNFTRKIKSRGIEEQRTTDMNRKTIKNFIGIGLISEFWKRTGQIPLFDDSGSE
jgi:putative DNA primase/helicase